MIDVYFAEIEDIINHSSVITKSDIEKIKLDDFSGVVKGKLFFISGILDFVEVINLVNNPYRKKKKYRYHFMSNESNLIFRYDNAGHHPELETFPYHKHIIENVIYLTQMKY
jgi:hypothetical protein